MCQTEYKAFTWTILFNAPNYILRKVVILFLFANEESGSQRSSHLPGMTQLLNDGFLAQCEDESLTIITASNGVSYCRKKCGHCPWN